MFVILIKQAMSFCLILFLTRKSKMVCYGKLKERYYLRKKLWFVWSIILLVWNYILIFIITWTFLHQWVVKRAINFDIGVNPSAEKGGEDEGVAVKIVDIIDIFRLQIISSDYFFWILYCYIVDECDIDLMRYYCVCVGAITDKKQFVMFMNRYIRQLISKLDSEKQKMFKKNIESVTKFLV